MNTATKPRPATHAERGRMGARAKWGPQRLVRLDDLTVEQRNVVVTLVEAMAQANALKGKA